MIVNLISAATTIHMTPAFLDRAAWPGSGLAVLVGASQQPLANYVLFMEELLAVSVIIVAHTTLAPQVTRRARFTAPQAALAGFLKLLAQPVTGVAHEIRDRWPRLQPGYPQYWRSRHTAGSEALTISPHARLNELVRDLRGIGGFVAVQHGTCFTVVASLNSIPLGHRLGLDGLAEDRVDFATGVVTMGARRETALAATDPMKMIGLESRVACPSNWEVPAGQPEARLDPSFERAVEECLQHLSDYTQLGQSGLVRELRIEGTSHIEQAKVVRRMLVEAIDSLRPAGARPGEVLPREWHIYAILHDAYVEDVPNRDIMTNLYISEGTFNRQRRKALRAVATALLERRQPPASVSMPGPGRDSRSPPTHNIGPASRHGSETAVLPRQSTELG